MFSSDGILGRNFQVITAGLDGLAMRQRVHAENLANVDTEGYRARTVDFEKVLRSHLSSGPTPAGGGSGMGADGAALPSSMSDAMTGGGLATRFSVVKRAGTTGVSRNTEVGEMAMDAIRFRVLTQQVTNRINGLRGVISEMGRA